MKRYILSSKYTQQSDVVLDDKIFIDIEIDIPYIVQSSSSVNERFPGVDQFRLDVTKLLEDKFHFEVIEDTYDGVRQKGHITNRKDSVSVYFDTYFDLSNADEVLKELGVTNIIEVTEGKVYCFVHLRFSDHELNDEGDVLHRKFISENANKYDRQEVTHIIKEESIDVPERVMYQQYNQALIDLEYELKVRISMWVHKLDRYKKIQI